jgi:hypothetical protein
MGDILIRGLSSKAIAKFDAEASALGISRAEVLRRRLESDVSPVEERLAITSQDWEQFSRNYADLADPTIMGAAWR